MKGSSVRYDEMYSRYIRGKEDLFVKSIPGKDGIESISDTCNVLPRQDKIKFILLLFPTTTKSLTREEIGKIESLSSSIYSRNEGGKEDWIFKYIAITDDCWLNRTRVQNLQSAAHKFARKIREWRFKIFMKKKRYIYRKSSRKFPAKNTVLIVS